MRVAQPMQMAARQRDSDVSAGQTRAARSDIVYSIQILRALAALLVVVRHTSKAVTQTQDAFALGQCGVDIFFVISGVVIYLTGRDLDWRLFLRRRIARIVPLYWLMTMVALGVNVLQAEQTSAVAILLSFLFLPSVSAEGVGMPPLYVGWTLNFEMWFYVACAIALALRGQVRFLWAASALIGMAVLVGLLLLGQQGWEPTPATFLLMPILLEFIAGLWVAHAYSAGRRSSPLVCAGLVVGAIAWLILAPTAAVTTVWRPLSWGIPAIAITWAMLSLEKRLPFARWTWGLVLAEASFALYLVHPLVIGANIRFSAMVAPQLPSALLFAMIFGSAIIAGLALHYLVELRLIVLAKRWLNLSPVKARTPAKPAILSIQR